MERNRLGKQKIFCHCFLILILSIGLLSFIACTVNKIISTYPHDATPTESAYRKAVIHPFEADQDLIKNHPNAGVLCENATFHELLKIGAIPMIVKTASTSLREMDTIIVKVRLTSVSETKQIHGKTKTGPAKLTAQVRLIDASNGRTVHDKNISLADQSSIKSTGDAPELGKLIARYISQIVRSK